MKRLLVVMLLFFLLSVTVLAISADDLKYLNPTDCDDFLEQLNVLGNDVPDGVPFQDELLNLQIDDINLSGNIEIINGTVVSAKCGLSENSTYDLELDNLSAINDILLDEDPVGAYLELKESGVITIEANTYGGKIKLFFANALAKVMSWFS